MDDREARAYVVGGEDGIATSFVGALMVTKAAGDQTGGAFDVLDQRVPPGYAPPRHRHEHEDEAWFVLDGEATFWCGSRTLQAGAGSFVFLPRGVEHAFLVGAGGARLLTMTAPSGFAQFVAEAGVPAAGHAIPDPEPIDEARLAEIAARYGIVITGPPPR